jgi:hypothetical protein
MTQRKQLVRWERVVDIWVLRVRGRECGAATVYDNGTWHTWNYDGVGGENSCEETVERAKIEAAASAIQQGFI